MTPEGRAWSSCGVGKEALTDRVGLVLYNHAGLFVILQ